MSNILILNKTNESIGIALKNGPTTQLTNFGPPGSIDISAEESNICIAPQAEIKPAEVYKSKGIDLEGKFVVEIDDKIIPLVFDAEDLPHYFNEENSNQADVAFFPASNIPEISCTDAKDSTGELILNGEFGLRLNGETLGKESNTLAELQTLLAAHGIEMTISAEPAKPGTTILKSTAEVGASVWVKMNTVRDVEIDWGDGLAEVVPAGTNGNIEHVFINGQNNEIRLFTPYVGQQYVITGAIDELVDFGVGNPLFGSVTQNPGTCAIQKVPAQLPSHVKSIRFQRCNLFNDPNIVNWDVSKLTNVEGAFQEAVIFDQPIGVWKLTSATSLRSFLEGATAFNQNLNDLDVSSKTDLTNTFSKATSYNQPMNKWDVSNVINMTNFLSGAQRFNQNLNDWNTANVQYMSSAFQDTLAYNQPMDNWNVSKTFAMTGMFLNASAFSQDLTSWCVSLITTQPVNFSNKSGLTNAQLPVWGTCPTGRERLVTFKSNGYGHIVVSAKYLDNDLPTSIVDSENNVVVNSAPSHQVSLPEGIYTVEYSIRSYTGPTEDIELTLAGAGVSEIVEFSTFKIASFSTNSEGSELFNLTKVPVTAPNVVSLNLNSFFKNAVIFNDPNVSRWDVSSATDFGSCFEGCGAFNQNLNEWIVSAGTQFSNMFKNCTSYNQPMIDWDVSNGINFEGMFQGCSVFDRDISPWLMENATNLNNFIEGASSFNQNLSKWCMKNIITRPIGWEDLTLSPWNAPVWGTCPRGESPVTSDSTVVVFDTSKPHTAEVITGISLTGPIEIVWTDGTKSIIPVGVHDTVSLPTWMTNKPGQYQVSINTSSAAWLTIRSPLTKVIKWSDGKFDRLTLPSEHLVSVPSTKPTGLTDFTNIFQVATIFNDPALKFWDVSDVVTFDGTFDQCKAFNQPLEDWDVGSATSMDLMFFSATSFNQDLSQWCVANITEEPSNFNPGGVFGGIISPENLPVWGSCPRKKHEPTANATVLSVDTKLNNLDTNAAFQITTPLGATVHWPNGSKRVIPAGETTTFTIPNFTNITQTNFDVIIEQKDKCELVVNGGAIKSIKQWSEFGYNKLSFAGCTELTTTPEVSPPLLTDYSSLFDGCIKLNSTGLTTWDVLSVTNFRNCFAGCVLLNQDISSWEMDNAINVIEMLKGTTVFNQDLSKWCTTNITPANRTGFSTDSALTTEHMPVWGTCPRGKATVGEDSMVIVIDTTKPISEDFARINTSENSTIVWADDKPTTVIEANSNDTFSLPQFMIDKPGQYQVSINCEAKANITLKSPMTEVVQWAGYGYSNLELMSGVLVKVPDTAPTGLTNFNYLFANATIFNDPNVSKWDVTNVTDFNYVYHSATKFNQPLASWNVENATTMLGFLDGASDYDQDLSGWCVTNITEEPSNFNNNGKLTPAYFPVWGTCPTKD